MDTLKLIAMNGVSMLLALLVAFFLLYLLGKSGMGKPDGCSCSSNKAAAPGVSTDVAPGQILEL